MDQKKQNNEDRTPATGARVIAVKLPFDLQERILSFPFLHALREKYPDSDLHFITPVKNIEVLNLLPFEAYYHECEEKDVSSIFDVHRFCVNARIYNVDLYFTLTDSFYDACLGLGLRSKLRVGFSDKWKSLFLTHTTARPVGHHIVEDYFALFKAFTGEDVDTKLKVLSRDLTPIVKVWENEPYIAINLFPLVKSSISHEWLELISLFEGKKIVLFASGEDEKIQQIMDDLVKILPKKNQYYYFVPKTWIEMARMMSFSRGVISRSGAAAALSAYTGSKTLILYEREDPRLLGPFYFLAEVSILRSQFTPFKMEDVFQKAQEIF